MPLGLGYLIAFLLEPVLSGLQEVLYWISKLPIFCWIPVVAFWWHYLVGSGYLTWSEALSLYVALTFLLLLYAVLMELRNIADLLRTHKTQLGILIEPHCHGGSTIGHALWTRSEHELFGNNKIKLS